MRKFLNFVTLLCFVMASFWTAFALAANAQPPADNNAALPANSHVPSSKTLEKNLQSLPWDQFRSVIESVPKLKADVERYGPRGWKYVQVNYQSYGWKKNIDKLDDYQRKLLVELIQKAKNAK